MFAGLFGKLAFTSQGSDPNLKLLRFASSVPVAFSAATGVKDTRTEFKVNAVLSVKVRFAADTDVATSFRDAVTAALLTVRFLRLATEPKERFNVPAATRVGPV